MKATAQTFPYEHTAPTPSVDELLHKGSVVTLFAQVTEIDLGWARRVRLQLQASLGAFAIETHLDQLPDGLEAGDWVRMRALRRHGEDPSLTLLGLTLATPDCKAAWLPTALVHRSAHIQRLRRLLETLDPALQLLFQLALTDAQLQRWFFWRVAAGDHHCYPGGLLDQSVEAAELAGQGVGLDQHERGIAVMAALLFDLGKAGDAQLAPDLPRAHGALASPTPHRFTARRLERAVDQARRIAPELIDAFHAVLFGPADSASPDGSSVPRIAQHVRQAVLRSWERQRLQ